MATRLYDMYRRVVFIY